MQLVSWVGNQTTRAPSVLAAAFLASLLFRGRPLAATSLVQHGGPGWPPGSTGGGCWPWPSPPRRGLLGAAGALGTLLALPRAAAELLAEVVGFAGGSPERGGGGGKGPLRVPCVHSGSHGAGGHGAGGQAPLGGTSGSPP